MEKKKQGAGTSASNWTFLKRLGDRKWDNYKVGIALIFACTLIALNVAAAEKTSKGLSGLIMVPVMQGENKNVVDIKKPSPVEAALLSTEIEVVITGFITRTKVRQEFENKSSDWMEGIYKFPLPEAASVDGMVMMIGERRIVSVIREKKEAQQIYTKAAAAGKKAALLDQISPNMFTTRIANIEPGSKISVEITFQALAQQEGAGFTWRMPQAITPRYKSGFLPTETANDIPATEQDEYAEAGGKNLSKFTIVINQVESLEKLQSPSHDIDIKSLNETDGLISLSNGTEAADRDFILNWQYAAGKQPNTHLFMQSSGGNDFVLGIIQPPKLNSRAIRSPRDITFIIDVSGSMHGTAIDQARVALLHALSLLRPADQFDIIAFNNESWRLFGQSRAATKVNILLGRRFVTDLDADGGTEMYPALASALEAGGDKERLRQILFLTDGAVSDEQAMFDLVKSRLHDARLFTVGLGSAPNGWFMRKAAELGRGIHIQVDNLDTAQTQLEGLFDDMSSPWARNIELVTSVKAEIYPKSLPDLFGTRPVIFVLKQRSNQPLGKVSASLSDYSKWSKTLLSEAVTQEPTISKFWARHKIESLLDGRRLGMSDDIIRAGVIQTALTYEIMSPYTSFVAVDKTPVRVQEDFLKKVKLQANIPAGTTWAKLHGPKTASALYGHLFLGALSLFGVFLVLLGCHLVSRRKLL